MHTPMKVAMHIYYILYFNAISLVDGTIKLNTNEAIFKVWAMCAVEIIIFHFSQTGSLIIYLFIDSK